MAIYVEDKNWYISDNDWAVYIDFILMELLGQGFNMERHLLGHFFGQAFYISVTPRSSATSPLQLHGIGVVNTGERKQAGKINRSFDLNKFATLSVSVAIKWVEMGFPVSVPTFDQVSLSHFAYMVQELINMMGYQSDYLKVEIIDWPAVEGYDHLDQLCREYHEARRPYVIKDEY